MLGVAAALGVGLSSLLVHTGVVSGIDARGTAVTATPADVDRTDELMSLYGCSTRGLGKVIPAHAIVRRTATGEVRLVSFDRGWAAYEGRLPGLELVAVCRL